jgi:carboxyl-terminal processing protease
VKITVIRDGQTLEFSITRDAVNVPTVDYSMEEDLIGYIAISQFDDVTTEQFVKAVTDLQSQGMKGLVIDIRSNPGGVLSVVVDILDQIVPKGLIVYTEDVDGNRKVYNGTSNNELNIPMAVLVDGNSASASEIFAGVMQDYEKAAIIGTQTFGKGIVQTIQPLTDGSAIKYTIAKYYTAKGQDIHGHGVTPDYVVENDENADVDAQYEAAIEYVKSKLQN